ncbi:Transposase IS200-like protein, partial [gut metagenome]
MAAAGRWLRQKIDVFSVVNGERDHVHLRVSKAVNSLKGVSSRMLRKQSQARFERCFGSCLQSLSYFSA